MISGCHPSEGTSKHRAPISIIRMFYFFQLSPHSGDARISPQVAMVHNAEMFPTAVRASANVWAGLDEGILPFSLPHSLLYGKSL